MLHLCVTDIHGLTYADLRVLLSEDERARLDFKKSEAYRVSSAAGRLLATALYRHVFKKEASSIVLSELGAPSFLGEDIALSISHSGHMVAVALSDTETCVGIDIEECRKADEKVKQRRTKIRERLRLPTVTQCSELPPFYRATFRNGHLMLTPSAEIESTGMQASAFLRDYTALEAVMKGEGRGFSALCDFAYIYPLYDLSCGVIADRENIEYILTVATKCK